MREIEFVAWETISKSMMTWKELLPHLSHILYATKQQNIKLMQYTGLKDKNKKKIYDGFICKVWPCINGEIKKNFMICVVKWHDGSGGMWSSGWVLDRRDGKYEATCTNDEGIMENVQVIGNIYKNPELLKKSR